MNHLSNIGLRASRFIARLLFALTLTLARLSPVRAQPLAQPDGLDPNADACSLVTEQEAGMALGADPGPGEVATSRDASSCTYGSMPSIVHVNLVSSGGHADYNQARELAQPGQVFDVAGVGDEAFGASAGPSAGIWLYKGDSLVVINLVAGLAPPPPTDQIIRLAKTAASRM